MKARILILAVAPLAAGLMLAFEAAAQDHSQHQMPAPTAQDHPHHQVPAVQNGSDQRPAAEHAPEQGVPEQQSGASVDHGAMGHEMPRPADQPATPIPVLTDADRAAAIPPPADHPAHDNTIQSFVLIDRLEWVDADEGYGMEWEGQAWIGTDYNKLWLRSEGERIRDDTEDADLEVLYGRSIAPWWDVVAGVRHHFEPGGSQDLAVLGVMGVTPYKFELAASVYVGDSGYFGARLEAEYDILLTNRLILQPAIEVNVHGRDDESHGNGSGLGTVEAGLRLRYEFTRQLAPYVGIVDERAYGGTADFRRDEGQDINDTHFVAGLRVWF